MSQHTTMMHVLLLTLCLLLPEGVLAGQTYGSGGKKVWDYSPLETSDLILRGTVVSVADAEITSADFWMTDPKTDLSPPIQAALIKLQVLEVLRGPSRNGVFSFLVVRHPEEVRSAYEPGSEMVACLFYNARMSAYYQTSHHSRYVKSPDGWQSGEGGLRDHVVADNDLRNRIAKNAIESVASDAELIVEGVIESVESKRIQGPDMSSAELVTITLLVDGAKKGRVPGDRIKMGVITRGLYWPEWRRSAPQDYRVGQKWLCFLKKGEFGWYPFAGANSLLQVMDNKLLYAERVEYWQSKASVERVIAAVPEQVR